MSDSKVLKDLSYFSYDTWRVDDDHVRAQAFVHQGGEDVLCRAAAEGRVVDAVALRVFLGVVDRLGDDLDAQHFLALAGHHQADGARAAVDVAQAVVGGEIGDSRYHRPYL